MAEKSNIQVSFGINGMQRQNFSHLIDEKAYTYMLNGNIETDDESIGLTNEHSNFLCSKFKPGYVVIGHKFDTINSKVWFLITEKYSKVVKNDKGEDIDVRTSEIGFINVSSGSPDLSDSELDCGCDMESILSTPLEKLENTIQHCTYTTLIADDCNYCLNFDPNYPAHNIILKQEACGFTMTFATKNNPPRYIILDKIDYYRYNNDINCGIDNTTETCIDCDKLRLFPVYKTPTIVPQAVNYGGRLKRGSYEYYLAYCDKLGNELTSYIASTNPIQIFDDNNIQLEQTTNFSNTNYAIKLKIENLDKRFNFYKIAVVEITDVNEVVSVYEEGIHSIVDNNVTHTSSGSENDKRLSLNRLFLQKPVYKNFGGMTTSNGILFGYDYEVEKEWNLQPVVNLMGSFVKWQTVEASENLYKDGVNISLYKSFMRDEVYPLAIKFGTDYGYETALFPLIGRPPLSSDIVKHDITFNTDTKSVLSNTPQCGTSDRNKKWQFYNTAKILGNSVSNIVYDNGVIVNKNIDGVCNQEDVKTYENLDIDISLDVSDNFYGLSEWINTNSEDICQSDPESEYYNEVLCEMLQDDVAVPCDIDKYFTYPVCEDYEDCMNKYCDIESDFYDAEKCRMVEENCENGICVNICPDIEVDTSRLYISDILNETITYSPKRYPGYPGTHPQYEHDYPKIQCANDNMNNPIRVEKINFYNRDGNVVGQEPIEIWGGVTSLKDTPTLLDNVTCNTASPLPSFSQNITSLVTGHVKIEEGFCSSPLHTNIIFKSKEDIKDYDKMPAGYVFSKDSLLSDINAPAIAGFENKILKSALWYEIEFEDDKDMLFEITPAVPSSKCVEDTSNGDGEIRYVIYDKCKTGNILKHGTYLATEGLFLVLKKSDFGRKKILISIDTKIIKHVKRHENLGGGGCFRVYEDSFYITTTICGCFNVQKRAVEYYKVNIKADLVKISKETTYDARCKVNAPSNDDCGVIPHKYGMFAYWESTEDYPDNSDLYDSSNVKLKLKSLIDGTKTVDTAEIVNNFINYYSQGVDSEGNIVWKTVNEKPLTNFTCEPIRHFKMPDNIVIPFMSSQSLMDFNDSRIFPVGITINEKTISVFLDAAVESKLITQAQRDSIVSYEIYRGDRSVSKSVIYKGIGNDMYEDIRDANKGQRTFFRNFPYNTLGKNAFITEDKERTSLVKHPFGSERNNRFSMIAPEVYYNRPKAPSEMTIDGYMYGKAISKFQDVDEHSEWVILGEKAYKLAETLARAEIALEAALNLATLTLQSTQNNWFMLGISGGGNPIGSALSIAAIAVYSGVQIRNLLTVKLPKLKTQWLQIFEERGSVYNFASMQVSNKGFYNYFKPNMEVGSRIRGLATSRYLNNGVDALTEVNDDTVSVTLINNKDRENSIYLYTGDKFTVKYPKEYINYDNADISQNNSSRNISSNSGCKSGLDSVKRIASPYFTLKNYVPDQYGKIDEIRWLSLNHDINIGTDSKNIFGGDTFISRVDFKNKVKLFNRNAVDLVNRTPFKYSTASNIGYTRFYVDHKSAEEDQALVNDMPYLSSQYNLDCRQNSRKFYESDPSKFYLFSYGVPYFLVESEINANFRYAGKEPHEQFASRGLNVDDWVQEKTVSIAYNNIFYYNNAYSRNQTGLKYRILPSVYDREKWDCLAESENGVAWSEEDNSEVSLSDPWLVFKPFNIYRFPFSYGKLISLNPLESTQVMGRFANNMAVFNAIDILKERVTQDNVDLGTGGVFAQRPVQFSFTELGETGSQHKSMVSNEFGHFWTDAKRGKVYQLEPNAKGLSAISDFKKSGEESGMRKWFKRHLPFKILKQGILGLTEEKIDNHFKGLGILMWWDSRFKRVFITKKDYTVNAKYKNKIYFSGGNLEYIDGAVSEKIELNNPKYFKEVSWTLAYSPIYNNWISYYDFKPDYAIAYNDFFQTGLNYSNDSKEVGIWSHLLTNKSFQVYYGKKYPWTIEIPVKNVYSNNVLKDLKIWAQSKRYHNEYDYAMWRKKSFNKLIVYNQTNNSGLLNLNYDDSMNKSKYPINMGGVQQGIQATHFDEQLFVNYFYNRVKKEDSHLPIWTWDENEIDKDLNPNAISFNSKRVLERLRGDWFSVRLTQDENTQFKHYFKWLVSVQEPYQ